MRPTLGISVMVLAVTVSACMSAGSTRVYPVRPFYDAVLAQIDTGITPDSLVAVLGQPDTTYAMTLGKAAGSEWAGVAYRYYATQDTSYKFVDRWKRNVFYFYKDRAGRLRLNHWTIEHVRPGTKPSF